MFHVKRMRILCHTSRSGVASINRLLPIGAVVVGVAHAGLAPVFAAGGIHPNLVLVAVVFAAAGGGLLRSATVAFVGGLVAGAFTSDPVGTLPLALVAVAVAASSARPGEGLWTPPYAVAASIVGSVACDLLVLWIGAIAAGMWRPLPLDVLAQAAAVNGSVAGLAATAWLIAIRHRQRPDRPAEQPWRI
jgi:hypothetical protein